MEKLFEVSKEYEETYDKYIMPEVEKLKDKIVNDNIQVYVNDNFNIRFSDKVSNYYNESDVKNYISFDGFLRLVTGRTLRTYQGLL